MNLKTINNILEYLLPIGALYILITDLYPPIRVFPFIFYFTVLRIIRKKYNIKEQYILMGLIAIYLSIMGGYFLELYNLPYYDKALHLLLPLALTFIICEKFKIDIPFKKTIIVLIVMGIGSIWELIEYFIDKVVYLPVPMQNNLIDTMNDLFFTFIGSVSGIFIKRK